MLADSFNSPLSLLNSTPFKHILIHLSGRSHWCASNMRAHCGTLLKYSLGSPGCLSYLEEIPKTWPACWCIHAAPGCASTIFQPFSNIWQLNFGRLFVHFVMHSSVQVITIFHNGRLCYPQIALAFWRAYHRDFLDTMKWFSISFVWRTFMYTHLIFVQSFQSKKLGIKGVYVPRVQWLLLVDLQSCKNETQVSSIFSSTFAKIRGR